MIQDAINFYHDGLTDDIAAEADHQLRTLLKQRGLYFGDRPVCVVLRPHFYFESDWAYLRREMETLLQAFMLTHKACLADAKLREQLMLHEFEEELITIDPDIVPWTSSRLDTFFLPESHTLNCVEYNAETPAGIGYGDVLSEVFLQLEPMKRFQERYTVNPMFGLDNLLQMILRAYRVWGGTQHPQIGILDWHEVPTLNEHEICRAHFEQQGYPSILADPRQLDYRNGHLYSGDFRIDIVYKRVLVSELIDVMGLDNPIVRAARDHAVMVTNSFSAKLLAKKASLAFLSDERNEHLFSHDQLASIRAHIPWTRVVRDRKTLYHDEPIDLVSFIADHRERFVLKPNDEYGGKGVVLGWESSADGWEAALHQALNTPHVVQERVPTVRRPFPAWIDDALDLEERFVDAAPYVFYGESVSGCLTRLSSMALLNVTAGAGSVVPTLLINRKS